MKLLKLALMLLLCGGPAMAAEGVLQINQTCAAVGCFDGDLPGFPVTITHAGSYRLTSNLDLSDYGSPGYALGIQVNGTDITIDLNGFSIQGGITCTGTPVTSCSDAAEGGAGIKTSSASYGVAIRNGHVNGFSDGVYCYRDCTIENIEASGNASNGISIQNTFGLIRNSSARGNGDYGFLVTGTIIDSVAEGNGTYGIFMQPGGIARGNTSRRNGGNGFRCYSCLLHNNISYGNGGYGVEMGSRAAWGGNLVSDNDAGAITGSGLSLTPNRCDTTTCP
ncbi:MAG TPA: right-handed parallel beta-helix repeat-containing protein [Rhodanobacteraceae bacterium]|nr:right-handed parallel beta-helix repeat-containing protein [Rhodanobacteraceae bacterium]